MAFLKLIYSEKATKFEKFSHSLGFDIIEYRISANSFRGNYSFLEVEVRQVFKGGNYSFLLLGYMMKLE